MRMIAALRQPAWPDWGPGLLTAITIALAATFVSEHQGGPQLLYALFFGMAFNFAANGPKVKAGIDFASRQILRFGVALLGARITMSQIVGLGIQPVLMVIVGVTSTILVGALLARLLRRPLLEGLLTGGAVAICGASAALAIAAVLPRNEENQRATLFTVVGVTALSTLAMIVYPTIAKALGMDANSAAIFLGGTIHDVAQVVAAGYLISPQVGDTAVFVKLLRVAMLLPVVAIFSMMLRGRASEQGEKPPLLPNFLIGFVVLVAVNSLGWIPPVVAHGLSDLSRWCLVVAIAALGIKTSLQQLAQLGWRPVLLLATETLFLAGLFLGGLCLLR